MNIWEIDNAILACVDEETGEIIEPEKLESLQMERDAKVEGVFLWCKDLDAENVAIKAEIDKLRDRIKKNENKIESLKRWGANALDGSKFKTAKVSISYRTSQSVEVVDINALPTEFLKFAEPTANKTAIKEAIKAGEDVAGAVIVTKTNMIIK